MKRIIIFTFLCLLYSCNVFNLDGGDPVLEFGTKNGAIDPNTGLDAWGYDPLSTTHVSAWNMPATDLTLTLPISDGHYCKYDFTIDWGDGTVESIGGPSTTGLDLRGSGYTTDISHTYTTAGVYTIEITGTFEEWSFEDFISATSTSNDNINLIRVHSFGDLGYKYLNGAFKDCTNLTLFAGGYTQNVTVMNAMFYGTSGLTSLDLSSFDTSNVTSMGNMFRNASSLTSLDLTNWDTDPLPSSTSWISGMTGTIICNDPDSGGTGSSGSGTVNGTPCN